MRWVLSAVALLLASLTLTAAVGCLDESGNPVDWWVMLKAPKVKGNSDASAASGMGYAYGDVNNPTVTWTGLRLDTNLNGALGSTLGQIYSNPSGAFVMYNDQPPGVKSDPSSSYAHSKGAAAWDSNQGFWLVHSIPQFPPPATSTYAMSNNAYVYGQSFICLTLGASTMDSVGAALMINRPYVYSSNNPSSLSAVSANLTSFLGGSYVTAPTATTINIQTAGGTPYTVVAKNRQWNSDLYSKFLAPTLQTSLYCETWMNGPASDKLPTLCAGSNPYSVINIDTIAITSSISWSETEDHSKWAISTGANPGITCIGDINRQVSQAHRGGGTVCGNNPTIWNSFSSFNAKSDACVGYNSRRRL